MCIRDRFLYTASRHDQTAAMAREASMATTAESRLRNVLATGLSAAKGGGGGHFPRTLRCIASTVRARRLASTVSVSNRWLWQKISKTPISLFTQDRANARYDQGYDTRRQDLAPWVDRRSCLMPEMIHRTETGSDLVLSLIGIDPSPFMNSRRNVICPMQHQLLFVIVVWHETTKRTKT